jgi:hypothetical protein
MAGAPHWGQDEARATGFFMFWALRLAVLLFEVFLFGTAIAILLHL